MSQTFDPYYTWLGIPPPEQPAHHYRLLSIAVFEQDENVIENAADKQTSYLKSLQRGKHAADADAVLEHIKSARKALLNPAKKAAYDNGLKKQLEADGGASSSQPEGRVVRRVKAQRSVQPTSAKSPTKAEQPAVVPTVTTAATSLASTAKARPKGLKPLIAVGLVALLAVVGGLIFALTRSGQQPSPTLATAPSPGVDVPPSWMPEPANETPEPAPRVDPPEENPLGKDGPVENPLIKNPLGQPSDPPAEDPPAPAKATRPEVIQVQDEPPVEAPRVKPSPPTDSAYAEIVARLEEVISGTDADPATLAKELLRRAVSATDLQERYVMLDRARLLASEGCHITTAQQAVSALGESHELDVWALTLDTFRELSRSARTVPQRREFAGGAIQTAQQAAAVERYNVAQEIAGLASAAAARASDVELRKSVLAGRNEIRQAQQLWQGAKEAQATLFQTPDDPPACETLGRYLCLVKQDWSAGLQLLAKSGDEQLRQVAKSDLEKPQDAQMRTQVADDWWKWVSQSKSERAGFLPAAQFWYRRALPDLRGLPKVHVQQQLKSIGDLSSVRYEQVAQRPQWVHGAVLALAFDGDTTFQREGRTWVRDLSGLENHSQLHGAQLTMGQQGHALQLSGPKQFAQCEPAAVLQLTDAVSVAVWFKATSWTNQHYLGTLVGMDAWEMKERKAWGYVLRCGTDGTVSWAQAFNGGWPEVRVDAQLELDAWWHLATTFDGQTVKLFINGEHRGERRVPGAISISEYPLRIGAGTFDVSRQFQGLIDEVAVWNRDLSDDEVKQLYEYSQAGGSYCRSMRMPPR